MKATASEIREMFVSFYCNGLSVLSRAYDNRIETLDGSAKYVDMMPDSLRSDINKMQNQLTQ